MIYSIVIINYNMDEYISIENIKSTKINCGYNEGYSGEKVYQIQPIINRNMAYLVHVGYMDEIHDILIKKFKISNQYQCHIISKIYNQKKLVEIENGCIFPLIKFVIGRYDNEIKPLGIISFNFHTSEPKKIMNHLAQELQGYYTLKFNFIENNSPKIVDLETFDEYPGQDTIFRIMTEWTFDENILNILNKMT